MTFNPEQIAALTAPLDRAVVKKNPRGFNYVEAWHAIAEANRIFGFDGWDRETVLLTETSRELVELQGNNGPYKQWRVSFIAKVKITAYCNGDPTVREGTGFGSGMSKPEAIGDAIESAAKEAESDAMKRALMTFGNPFGLALYDKEQTNVADAPSAEDTAKAMLRGASADAGLFKEAWLKNKDAWKRLLPAASYARVVEVMQECAAKHKPAETAEAADTFRGPGPGGVAGNNGDDQANPFAGAH